MASLGPALRSERIVDAETSSELTVSTWENEEWDYSLIFVTAVDDSTKACGIKATENWIDPVLFDFKSFISAEPDRFEALDDRRVHKHGLLRSPLPPLLEHVDREWRERTLSLTMKRDFNNVTLYAALVEREN